ncbi:hypothetical protein V6N13_001268 [Hibiscus sabdariffa]
MLHVILHGRVGESTTDETFSDENGVLRVHGDLVLGRITDEALGIGESDVGGRGLVALIVGNNLDLIILPHPNTTVGGAEINPNCFASFSFGRHLKLKRRSG